MTISKKTMLLTLAGSATAVLILGAGGCSDNDVISSSGTVIDGYLQNATVCVDVNGNKECDSTEARNNTNLAGYFSVATLTSAPLVVAVTPGLTTDSLVMGQAGNSVINDFFLTAPLLSSTVTPLTTLVQVGVEQGYYTDFSAGSAIVATALNVSAGTDLANYDYLSAGDARVAVAATIVTNALASAIANIQANVTTNTENTYETAVRVLIDPSLAGGASTSLMQEIGSNVALAVTEGASVSDVDVSSLVDSIETVIESDTSIVSAADVDAVTLEAAVAETNAVNETGASGASGAAN
jgi:hypothetical protein